MKKKIKALWVAALRSGEYKQGTGQLRDESNNFCCLGVLCNLHAQAHPRLAAKQLYSGSYMGNEEFLPLAVQKWAGFKDEAGPELRLKGDFQHLAGMNDSGASFKVIAGVIEGQM